MNKHEKYIKLVEDVRHCTLCDQYPVNGKNGQITLTHDTGRRHINLWAEWQGSLDAEILMIGQDWGYIEGERMGLAGEDYTRKLEKYIDDGNIYCEFDGGNTATDFRTIYLFEQALGIDARNRNDKLFFTNSIQCYKTGGLSEDTSPKWFKLCNENYVKRLIAIIQPKVIITVGKSALLGLQQCGEFTDLKGNSLAKDYFKAFKDVIDNGAVYLSISDIKPILVCPVSHTGKQATNLFRNEEKQLEDWRKIKAFLD